MTNTDLLDNYIKESGLEHSHIAKALDISLTTFCQKRLNIMDFKLSEVFILCDLLKIEEDKEHVFFDGVM